MQQITFKLPDDTNESLEDYIANNDIENRSEALRELVEKGFEYDDLENERDRLERKLMETNSQQEKHDEIVEYVEQEKKDRQLEREVRSAPIHKRLKWKFTGIPQQKIDEEA